MVNDIYYENSRGEKLDLLRYPYRIQTGDLFNYEWEYTTKSTVRNTGRFEKFFRGTSAKEVVLGVMGNTIEEYHKNIDAFYEAVDSDVLGMTPGKLWFGSYYLLCYILKSEKEEWESDIGVMDNTITVVSDYPFWCRDRAYHFYASAEEIMDAGREEEIDSTLDNMEIIPDYPYDFGFDFITRYRPAKRKVLYDYKYDYYRNHTVGKLDNDHFAGSDFRMIVYGPCTHPEIRIGGNVYCVSTTLYDSEYMVIDSRGRTVTRYARNGVQENLFNARDKENNVFEKIPPGKSAVKWNAQYPFDVILFQERSEPAWNT